MPVEALYPGNPGNQTPPGLFSLKPSRPLFPDAAAFPGGSDAGAVAALFPSTGAPPTFAARRRAIRWEDTDMARRRCDAAALAASLGSCWIRPRPRAPPPDRRPITLPYVIGGQSRGGRCPSGQRARRPRGPPRDADQVSSVRPRIIGESKPGGPPRRAGFCWGRMNLAWRGRSGRPGGGRCRPAWCAAGQADQAFVTFKPPEFLGRRSPKGGLRRRGRRISPLSEVLGRQGAGIAPRRRRSAGGAACRFRLRGLRWSRAIFPDATRPEASPCPRCPDSFNRPAIPSGRSRAAHDEGAGA